MSGLGKAGKFLFGSLLFLGLAGLSGWLTLLMLSHGGDVLVPDVTSQELISALKILQDQRMYGVVDKQESHSSLQRGYIIRQDPQPGELKKQYSTVNLVISSGPEKMVMPDMRSYGIRQARIECAQIGLGAITEISIHHSGSNQGEIIGHSPGPGEVILPGGGVKFLISEGDSLQIFRMLDFIGQSINQARDKIGSGFAIETSISPQAGLSPGTIVSQIPSAGEPVTAQQIIKFQITPELDSSDVKADVFIYRTPPGLLKKNLKIVLETGKIQNTLYEKKTESSAEVKVFVPRSGNSQIKVYLDNTEVHSETW
jgi:beta-lactam-binding protein with PASTA domain